MARIPSIMFPPAMKLLVGTKDEKSSRRRSSPSSCTKRTVSNGFGQSDVLKHSGGISSRSRHIGATPGANRCILLKVVICFVMFGAVMGMDADQKDEEETPQQYPSWHKHKRYPRHNGQLTATVSTRERKEVRHFFKNVDGQRVDTPSKLGVYNVGTMQLKLGGRPELPTLVYVYNKYGAEREDGDEKTWTSTDGGEAVYTLELHYGEGTVNETDDGYPVSVFVPKTEHWTLKNVNKQYGFRWPQQIVEPCTLFYPMIAIDPVTKERKLLKDDEPTGM